MNHRNSALRRTLLAGVSVLALGAAVPNARAADIALQPPPASVYKPAWTWWIEGGAFLTGGGGISPGPGIGGFEPNWGAEEAIGFDWKIDPYDPWIVSAQVRYGAAKKSQPFNLATGGTLTGTTTFSGGIGGNQDLREHHWLVDFNVGRDFSLGSTTGQVKLGVRVADLEAKLSANGSISGNACHNTTTTVGTGSTAQVNTGVQVCTPASGAASLYQKSQFSGVGPRLSIEGETPLGKNWALDWMGGAAVLFGKRKLDINSASSLTTASVYSTSYAQSISDNVAIFNPTLQLGISYCFNPYSRITLSYRFDAYLNALKTIDANGAVKNIDRYYHGPMLRLTTKF